jgi:superfamily II DNA or RNA helicase
MSNFPDRASAAIRGVHAGRDAVTITVEEALRIAPPIPSALQQVLLTDYRLRNPKFDEAEQHGRSTHDLDEYLYYRRLGADGSLVVPKGATAAVYRRCQAHGVQVQWEDRTHTAATVEFGEHITLSPAQEQAVQQVLQRRMGVLEAPAGSGKTIMAMSLIARRRQPALIIVHTKELADQAIARAGMVLGLGAAEIGFVGDGKCTIGERLTVALVQTLARGIPPALLEVGHVVVDEAHHIPAKQMASVVRQFRARYLLGLTATPYRRDRLDVVIFWHLGPIVARMDKADLADRLIPPRIVKRDTGVRVVGDSFTTLVSQLVSNAGRNALICSDVARAVQQGRRCLVLTDRVEHAAVLAALLTDLGVAAAVLHGQLPKRERQEVVAALNAGALSVAVATGALVGEGYDCPALSALFLATPVSYEGRLIQYLGRVSRSAPGKTDALVYDYVDAHPMLYSSFGKRNQVYRRQREHAA